MVDKILPTVNFDANPGLDEFQFLHQTYSEEFRLRSRITAGVNVGVVDFSGDPAKVPYLPERPLFVRVSTLNPNTIDISPGYAITPSHLLVNIDSTIPSIPLPDLAADKVYVVAVEYKLVESAQQKINRFGTLTEVRLERPSNTPPDKRASTLLNAITIVDLNDYNNLSIFPEERLNNIVAIAVITVRADPVTGALTLNVDLSRDTYDFNRPWFSVHDVLHRSRVGSGIVSDNNPHGMELQDLSSAGLTLYQQLEAHGGVVAKDFTYYGYPGTLCREVITLSRLEVDYTGAVASPDGAPLLGGSYFVRLEQRPVRTGSLYFAGSPWKPVPYRWLEGTNVIVLGALERATSFEGSDLIFEYFSVKALEVNSESPTQGLQTLTVNNPIENQEFIVSGGQALSSLAQTTLSLSGLLGPIKRKYQLLCDKVGALLLSPQPLVAFLRVQDLVGKGGYQINQTPSGGQAVPIIIGLTRAVERTTTGSTINDLDVRLEISGLSESNTALTEAVTFKASQWKDQDPVRNVEEPLQTRTTKNSFMTVTSVRLLNTTSEPPNAGTDAVLSIWADSLQAKVNKELASAASFFWTGVTAVKVRDERLVATTLQKVSQKQTRFPTARPEHDLASVQEFLGAILHPALTPQEKTARLLLLESNDDRVYGETWNSFSSSDASASLQLTTFSALVRGQTLRIAPGKYLRFWAPDPAKPLEQADPSKGDVALGSSDVVFKSNLIATINDPVFDSTWFATLGSGGANPAVNLTRSLAYPEGLVLSKRINLNFSGNFTAIGQSVQFKINGTQIGPVSYVASSDPNVTGNTKTLEALRDAINQKTATTLVSAVILTGQNIIALHGGRDGEAIVVSDIVVVGSTTPALEPSLPLDSFTITQPSNGNLPTPHLPERYPSTGKAWEYLSRPILWDGTFLEAAISFTNNNVTAIADGDKVEIAADKILTAKNGSTTVDPARGDFLVDTSSDALAKTLRNIASTINNPSWASGVQAKVVDNKVVLRLSGTASARLLQVEQSASNLWVLDAYKPVGPGPAAGHAFIKTLRPLRLAEWRYKTVPTSLASDNDWSAWLAMQSHSPTAYSLHVPAEQSLYAVQFRLRSLTHEPNSFSVYQIIPHENGATVDSLTNLAIPVKNEVEAARGSTASLSARIASVVTASGERIQDSELVAARSSSQFSLTSTTLKERLDTTDTFCQWLAGGLTNLAKPALITPFSGMPNQLWSGPVTHVIQTGPNRITVGGTTDDPLIFTIQGYQYVYTRGIELTLSGTQAGTYYVKAVRNVGDELGVSIISNAVTTAASASNVITDTTKNFQNLGSAQVLPGHIVEFTNIQIQGQNYCAVVDSVTATQLTLLGKPPRALVVGEPYRVWSPRELPLSLVSVKQEAKNAIYLGEVVWSQTTLGSSTTYVIEAVRGYRYQNKYKSSISALVTANPGFSLSFDHNLGFIPGHFTLYLHQSATGDTEPKVVSHDDVVVKTSTYRLTIKNKFANQVGKDYTGAALTQGYFQLVID